MNLTVNGDALRLDAPATLRNLLESLRLNPDAVVVERNREIYRREDFDRVILAEGDQLEIVRLMAGG